MKIRLKVDMMVSPRHNMTKGRVLEATPLLPHQQGRGSPIWEVESPETGTIISVFEREAEVVKEEVIEV